MTSTSRELTFTAAGSAKPEVRFPVARYALALGIAGALYASLRPFTGWRAAQGPLHFLLVPWPVHVTTWDTVLNLVAYAALGLCAVPALAPRLRGPAALLAATAGLTLLSLGMEALQSYLPGRTSSAIDVATNAAGAFAGGLAALALIPHFAPGGSLDGWRRKSLVAGLAGDAGLVLLGAWFVALLAPRTLLYGNGDMRLLFGVVPDASYPEALLILVESVGAVANLVALGLIARVMTVDVIYARRLFLALFVASIVVRSAAFGLFWTAQAAFNWLTSGALARLGVGLPAALVAIVLPRRAAAAAAGALLILATSMVNVAPPNPHLWLKPRPTRQSELAPLSVMSRTTAMIWPLAAIAFVGWRWHAERRARPRLSR